MREYFLWEEGGVKKLNHSFSKILSPSSEQPVILFTDLEVKQFQHFNASEKAFGLWWKKNQCYRIFDYCRAHWMWRLMLPIHICNWYNPTLSGHYYQSSDNILNL